MAVAVRLLRSQPMKMRPRRCALLIVATKRFGSARARPRPKPEAKVSVSA
jgi:hypothetical protein